MLNIIEDTTMLQLIIFAVLAYAAFNWTRNILWLLGSIAKDILPKPKNTSQETTTTPQEMTNHRRSWFV
jgi:hypothetical protein